MQRPSISRLIMRMIPRTRPLLARCKLTPASGGFLGVATRHHFTASVLAQRPADVAWIVQRTAPALQSVRLLSTASTDGNSESEKMREVRIGAAYEKGQIDPSSSVTIHPPVGHDENTELAQQLGIFKVFDYQDGDRVSRITVAFQGKDAVPTGITTLDKFLKAEADVKTQMFPESVTKRVNLPPDVTEHFNEAKLPFHAETFVLSGNKGVSDCLLFAFQTGGGFWTVGWHVAEELFTLDPDLFFLFLRAIRVEPK